MKKLFKKCLCVVRICFISCHVNKFTVIATDDTVNGYTALPSGPELPPRGQYLFLSRFTTAYPKSPLKKV